MVEPWRMALVAFLPEPLTRQSFFGGRLSQRSWTYTNACKWKLIRRFTSSHSTGFGRERKNTSRMHSPWVYVAWPLPDHFHRHPDQMKPMDCSLASVAADTTLTSSTPTANPWEKKTQNATPPSTKWLLFSSIVFLINETSLCAIILQKSMINCLTDPASTSATFEINDSKSLHPASSASTLV